LVVFIIVQWVTFVFRLKTSSRFYQALMIVSMISKIIKMIIIFGDEPPGISVIGNLKVCNECKRKT